MSASLEDVLPIAGCGKIRVLDFSSSCVLTEWQNEWNENHKWTLRNVRAERLAGRFGLG